MMTSKSRVAMGRLAPSLVALLLGCTALAMPAHAGWLFGGDKDAPKQAAKAGGDTPRPAPATDIEGNVRQARMLREAGNYDEAIHHLAQLMLVASDDGRVVGEYGKTLTQMGRAQDAKQFLTRAAQLTPGDWTIASALGVTYDELGEQDMAKAAYERALALRPDEPSVLNNFALSRLLAHDPNEARQLAARARAAGGATDPKIRRNLAMIADIAPAPQGTGTPQGTAAPQGAGAPVTVAAEKPAAPVQMPVQAPVPVQASRAVTAAPAKAIPMQTATAYAVSGTDPAQPFVTLPATAAASATSAASAGLAHGAASSGVIDIAARPASVQPGGVVMQKTPADQQAGPVATRTPRALAAKAPAAAVHTAEAPPQAAAKPAAAKTAQPAPQSIVKNVVKTAAKTVTKPAPKAAPKTMSAPASVQKAATGNTIPALRLSANAY